MAKKMVKKKQSYGSCTIHHLSPPRAEGWPKAINVFLRFEEALKLQLAIQARLLEINALNRATREGKAAGVILCVHIQSDRLTVSGGSVK